MCVVCNQYPCDPRCPNADTEPYAECAYCEEPIMFGGGDVVIDGEGSLFCDQECLMDYYGCRYFDWDDEDGEKYEDHNSDF